MEKTYTQKIHFKLVIEGDYSCGNLLEEELYQEASEAHDNVLEYIGDNIIDYFHKTDITLDNLRTIEEEVS